MHTNLDQACVGREGMFCGERELVYLFLVQFFLISTPARLAHKVYSVAGDGFFNQEMIERFGFTNAKFISDYFHLFYSGKNVIGFVVRND